MSGKLNASLKPFFTFSEKTGLGAGTQKVLNLMKKYNAYTVKSFTTGSAPGSKGEIQYTLTEISNREFPSSLFKIPEDYKREAGRLAALLESADNGFGNLVEKIDAYKVDYGAYMTAEEMQNEIEMLKTILACAKSGSKLPLLLQLTRVARAAGFWDEILISLPKYLGESWRQHANLKIEYGYALCKKHEDSNSS